jgi:phosphomannomutase
MNTKIFKSYDIRGVYPTEIDESTIEAIGRATVIKLNAKDIAIGRDNRASSPALFAALVRGITTQGANVIDIGLATTPMTYFASHILPVDGAISLTASHNPGEYNGLKISLHDAVPLGLTTGLGEIRDIAQAGNFPTPERTGIVTTKNITDEYFAFIQTFADFRERDFQVAIDPAHAMGVLELPLYKKFPNVAITELLYGTLEEPGTCPHEANPLQADTLTELKASVIKTGADIGIAYDGDADRIGFVDERGEILPMDLVTAIIAPEILKRHPGATILYDLRSSLSVKEEIERAGGIAHECKVGHANIKRQMRDEGAVFAGELSGHYYFNEGYAAEMGSLPAILLMNIMSSTDKKLSELVASVKRYAHSGEINMEISNAAELMEKVRAHYADGTLDELDGVKITYPDWWFSLRASNTEPLLRLNCEGTTRETMEKKRDELLAFIKANSTK